MPQSKRHWMDRASDPSTPATEDNETVRTATYEVNGRYYLVPTIRQGEDGSLYKPEDPLGEALENKDAFIFSSQEEADDMSKQISEHIGKKRQKNYSVGGDISDVQAQGSTSSGAGETNENFSGRLTYGNDDASITPSVSYNKGTRQTEFEDGVILNETGKRIGVAINGEIKLAEGIKLRGGIQKITKTSGGTAVYKGEVFDEFQNKSRELNANVGAQLGKLNIDYERRKQEQAPASSTFSAGYQIDKDSSVSGSMDFPSKRLNVEYRKQFAKGGNVEQMNKLFAEGGMMDDSGEQVNGVEVPPGSLREEVADDIPAQLSEGEFVVPADVVRYIGLEKLMAMRDKAKQGLKRMEEMGQMGNAEEVANPDQTFSEQDDADFEAEIDDIMAEEGSTIPAGFARGGFASGTDLTKASRNPMVDVRFFKNKEGKVMFITHINGVPLVPIPEGFEPTDESYEQLVGSEADKKAAEEAEKEAEELKRLAALGMGASSGGEAPTTPGVSRDPNDLTGAIEIDPETGQAKGKDFSKYAKLAMAILPAPIALIIQLGAKLSAKQNEEIAKVWNASDKYFNPDAVVGGDKSTGWVSLQKAQESGMGYTITGTSVSSTKSVQAQNKGLLDEFDLTDEEKAMYAVPTKEDILAQRQEDLDGSIVLGESRAREAAKAAAAKEAADKAAKAAIDSRRQEIIQAAAESRAEAARAAEINAQAAARAARQGSTYYGGSSGDSGGNGGYTSGDGTQGSASYSDYGGEADLAKGGLLKKRPTKPKATKKGLAAKRK